MFLKLENQLLQNIQWSLSLFLVPTVTNFLCILHIDIDPYLCFNCLLAPYTILYTVLYLAFKNMYILEIASYLYNEYLILFNSYREFHSMHIA